jgi:hypothetical protein
MTDHNRATTFHVKIYYFDDELTMELNCGIRRAKLFCKETAEAKLLLGIKRIELYTNSQLEQIAVY